MRKALNPTRIANLAQLGDSQNVYWYIRDIEMIPPLTAKQEAALAKKLRDPDRDVREKAKRELIEANLRLVVQVAKNQKYRWAGMLDLIQAGNLGLLEAANRFDPEKGARFSTYAVPWIKKNIVEIVEGHHEEWERRI
jgi:RNA polymerase primary sigma factor